MSNKWRSLVDLILLHFSIEKSTSLGEKDPIYTHTTYENIKVIMYCLKAGIGASEVYIRRARLEVIKLQSVQRAR